MQTAAGLSEISLGKADFCDCVCCYQYRFYGICPLPYRKGNNNSFFQYKDGIFYWDTIIKLLSSIVFLYLVSQFFRYYKAF